MRGTSGPVHVGFFNTVSEWCNEFVESCTAAGIPPTRDFNAPNGLMGASRVRYCYFVPFILFSETIITP